MTTKPEEYRAQALHCRLLADQAGNPLDKKLWLELAADWMAMASMHEQMARGRFDTVGRDRSSEGGHQGVRLQKQFKRVERHLELLRLTTDPAEIERIKRLISGLYADRVRLHQNSEQQAASVSGLYCPKCRNCRPIK